MKNVIEIIALWREKLYSVGKVHYWLLAYIGFWNLQQKVVQL